MTNQVSDKYFESHRDELAKIGVTEEAWRTMQGREAKIRELIARGMTHKRATEIVHGVDLSSHPAWQ